MVVSATEDTVRARKQKNNGGRSVVERTAREGASREVTLKQYP